MHHICCLEIDRVNILSFHESTVTKFLVVKNNFVIGLEGVLTDCLSDKVEIIVEDISKILIDSVLVVGEFIKAPYKDGEVLMLESSEKKIFILIEWNDFYLRESFIQSYEIKGNKIIKSIIE